jgi:hypothetical protein
MTWSKNPGKLLPAMAPCRDARQRGHVALRVPDSGTKLSGEAGRGRHARIFVLGRHHEPEGAQARLLPRDQQRSTNAAIGLAGAAQGGCRFGDLVGRMAMRAGHAGYLHRFTLTHIAIMRLEADQCDHNDDYAGGPWRYASSEPQGVGAFANARHASRSGCSTPAIAWACQPVIAAAAIAASVEVVPRSAMTPAVTAMSL